MKISNRITYFTLALCSNLCIAPAIAAGDDIDIFTGASGGDAIKPKVLIILDNSASWANNKQFFPEMTQGEAEASAISDVVGTMNDSISVGLMEYNTGTSGQDGGYIREAIKEMNATNKSAFQAKLATMKANYKDNSEKTGSNGGYGNLMRSAYQYFTGGSSLYSAGAILSLTDNLGYTADATTFRSPLTVGNTCGKTFIIFIGNAQVLNTDVNNGTDTHAPVLDALNPSRVKLETRPAFAASTYTEERTVGITEACYADKTAAAAGLLTTAMVEKCVGLTCRVGDMVTKNPDTCASGSSAYSVVATATVATYAETGGTPVSYATRYADDWALYMAEKGIPVTGTTIRPSVTTYTIDVHGAQPDANMTGLLMNMAKYGRGKYFKATSRQAIKAALETITSEIQAVNSAFASTSLPVNATNRSQNQNQVFIGMFRPDAARRPRWFGNLKKYQLVFSGGTIDLGDAVKSPAVNNSTGFMAPCARSFWTNNSGEYWNIPIGSLPSLGEPVKGNCDVQSSPPFSLFSDLPDGELVEKGAAAQMLRQGNSTTAASDSRALNRNIKTLNGTTLVNFDTATVPASSSDSSLVNWIRGSDMNNDKKIDQTGSPAARLAELISFTRPSIHGDVIHSRPLPVTYGSDSVVVYYGANDGALHAVDAATGVEKWSFVEPESIAKLNRLKNNSPLVSYSGQTAAHALVSTPKDYYFDGSIGLYQNAANATVQKTWIYPAMRRGGRRVYAFDVTTAATPVFKWRLGCRDVGDDEICDTGMESMGQAWSTPLPFFVRGHSVATAAVPAVGTTPAVPAAGPKPAVIFGGGYDKCEDLDKKIGNDCLNKTGQSVYVRDGLTGEVLKTFTPSAADAARSFAADIGMVDIDNDGYIDYAYAADTGGGLYRISFIDNPTDKNALAPANWTMVKVAQSPVAVGRKFLFQPALLYTAKQVYIAIGSGDREHPLEAQYPWRETIQNRIYVLKDNLEVASPTLINLDNLDNAANATCDTIGTTPSSTTSKGWYLNLENGRGEQTVTSALIAGGMVAFSTNRPHGEETGTCATTLGHAHGYWLNLFTGSGAIRENGTCGGNRSAEFAGGGLPPSPVLATSVPVVRDLGNGVTKTEFVTVAIGTVSKSGLEANVPFKPVKVPPTVDNRRKRSYTYTSSD